MIKKNYVKISFDLHRSYLNTSSTDYIAYHRRLQQNKKNADTKGIRTIYVYLKKY
jgi:hypothetical protein